MSKYLSGKYYLSQNLKKLLIIFVFYFLQTSLCCSQSLEGTWEGAFKTISGHSSDSIPHPLTLKFIFKKNKKKYIVHTYSEGLDTKRKLITVTCNVYYKLYAEDSIYLEELSTTSPRNALPSYLQKCI